VLAPYWGTREDLYEVVELAKEGRLDVHTEVFSLDDAIAGYDKLHAGTLDGRAVVVP
jgi:propanol-preferring alcohol dehydrogenase